MSTRLQGFYKFNVNGPTIGKSSAAGISGVLRNFDGEVMSAFLKSIVVKDSYQNGGVGNPTGNGDLIKFF